MLDIIFSTRFFNRLLDWYLEARNLEVLASNNYLHYEYTGDPKYLKEIDDYKCRWWDKEVILKFAKQK